MSQVRFDCFSGISGDMLLAALAGLGASAESLNTCLESLFEGTVSIAFEADRSGGITGLRTVITDRSSRKLRHLSDLLKLLEQTQAPEAVCARSESVFQRLAKAEATVHGLSVETVHFHEVGAVDTFVDVFGALLLWHELGLTAGWCSSVTVGTGSFTGAHGRMPLPAPATAILLNGFSLTSRLEGVEFTTPTGAALLAELAVPEPAPPASVDSISYGLGTRTLSDGSANALRLMRIQPASSPASHPLHLLEANIDDMSAEILAHVQQLLMDQGALDVWQTAIVMKKGRLGTCLSVLCSAEDCAALTDMMVRQTSTLGVRRHEIGRTELDREVRTIQTAYGGVRVKAGLLNGEEVNLAPEYEDCLACAEAASVPLKTVYRAFWEALS